MHNTVWNPNVLASGHCGYKDRIVRIISLLFYAQCGWNRNVLALGHCGYKDRIVRIMFFTHNAVWNRNVLIEPKCS